MKSSNIVAYSNVFLSWDLDPFLDSEFTRQIQDYDRLKHLLKRKNADNRINKLTDKQEKILENELRCVYAKDDPCWGYVNKLKRVVCACVNGECPQIYRCNPRYTKDDTSYWSSSALEREKYGNPKNLPKYYLVDMISDEEMDRYKSDPLNPGRSFPTKADPDAPKKKKQRETKIDPETGRKMVVVGYKWVITDNASYENEELIPIWGFVEEIKEEEVTSVTRRKAKKIEKIKQDTDNINYEGHRIDKTEDVKLINAEDLERIVSANISKEIKLTGMNVSLIADEDTVILSDNPAEQAYISRVLLENGIRHGIKVDHGIMLVLMDDYEKYVDRKHVIISSTVLKKGCRDNNINQWKVLSQKRDIIELRSGNREYYKVSYGPKAVRWTCRSMYGVTHVCVTKDDIKDKISLPDGLYTVSFIEEKNSYVIMMDGRKIGNLKENFMSFIQTLEEMQEIPALPETISGIALNVNNGKIDILGMGHLVFAEY